MLRMIKNRRTMVGLEISIVVFLLLPIVFGGCNRSKAKNKTSSKPRRVFVLGVDAMDFGITTKLLNSGRLPNFAALAREGTFLPLQTTMPPLSPVAWTNFTTGMNSGGHGVFDFLVRNPKKMNNGLVMEDGVTRTVGQAQRGSPIPFTKYIWPRESRFELRRKGVPFWDVLEANDVKATIYKMPANFPVSSSKARILSGMGTPDIEGTYGMFSYVTTDSFDWGKGIQGGRIHKAIIENGRVFIRNDGNGKKRPHLRGPQNIFLQKHSDPPIHTSVAYDIFVDSSQQAVAISIQQQDILLKKGEWSPWVRVEFEFIPQVKSAHGVVKFYLKSVSEELRLFISPVNLAPGSDGLATNDFDMELSRSCGLFYSKGMSEQTKAMSQGILTTDEYIHQSNMVLSERIKALDLLLANFNEGCLFFYISTLDLDSHIMWKHHDPKHPARSQTTPVRYSKHIIHRYEQMDKILGSVRAKLQPGDLLYVISDHGFSSFRRQVNLVRWLHQKGYLKYSSQLKARLSQFYSDIDWKQTTAYCIGFNGLCINVRGREASGIIPQYEYDKVVEQIRAELLALKDVNGIKVFSNIYRASEVYSGSEMSHAPDLILGYNSGYGPSDKSVSGTWGGYVISDRLGGFTGHHCMDYKLVPGVLFCNQTLKKKQARLEDITATILNDFGVLPPKNMTGVSLR